jgi:transposase InsO family protein
MFKEKQEFIREFSSGNYSIAELCRAFEISRPTAYRLIIKYEQFGENGLKPLSKAPKNHPNQTPAEIQTAILYFRNKYKNWGARKIRILLLREFDSKLIPSSMTIHNIMKNNGLVIPKKRFRRIKPIQPIYEAKNCNDVWSTDYKGKFLMANKKYCHPLTISDKKSRFLFLAKGHYKENFNDVKKAFTAIFKQFELPKQIHSDNGVPFGSVRAVRRYTRLSYWFIELGIEPVFSDPGSPQQNGKHERMHKDLKAACAKPAAFNMRAQQRKLNHFVKQYNYIRPHEALDMKTPAQVYQKSIRPFPKNVSDWEYPEGIYPRKITKTGAIPKRKWFASGQRYRPLS